MTDGITPSYCTPDEVAETLDLPNLDPDDNNGILKFSATTHPSLNQVNRMIFSNEEIIDRRLRRTWKEKRVVSQQLTLSTYWADINGARMDYYNYGGNYVQLRKDIKKWDKTKGDKLEIRNRNNAWMDITDMISSDDKQDSALAYFDYPYGKLYIRTRLFQQANNSIRITYRYGSDISELPPEVNRMCCLMTAIQVLNMQFFNIKVGSSGDLGSVKDITIRAWNDEINVIYSSLQRTCSVHSMLR